MHARAATLVLAVVVSCSLHAQCAARFDSIPSYAHGFFLALADFDGDGHLDTLTSVPKQPAVRVNFGRPDGSFDRGPATPMRAALGVEPHLFDAATGDWDEDGIMDAVVAADSLDAVELLLGRGDGTFAPAQTVRAFAYPRAVAAADFDGDGHLDLAVADPEEHTVAVFWGNGDGTFAAPLVRTADLAVDVIPGDFNADGKADLIIGRSSLGLDVLLSENARTFAAPQRLAVLRDHWGIVTRDIDGDAKLDVALADLSAFVVSTFRGNGDGTFQPRVDTPAGLFTEGVAFGDFTGDGKLDVVAGNGPDGNIVLFVGFPDGSFSPPFPYAAGGNLWGVHTADLNSDGRDDILAADIAAYSVLLQVEAGGFRLLESSRVAGDVFNVAGADFDGDGNPDLAAADLRGFGATILLGDGDGNLKPFTTAQLGEAPISIAAADFNGDDVPDLVAGCAYEVSIALGRGDGGFYPHASHLPADAVRFYFISPGDIDGDGDLDIAAVERAIQTVHFLINDGKGRFTQSAASIAGPFGLLNPLLADVNHDGAADLIHPRDENDVRQGGAGFLDIRLSRGDGTFGEVRTMPTGMLDPVEARAEDVDGDGHPDLIVSSWNVDGALYIYRGDGTGAFEPAAVLPADGQALHFVFEDLNRDGVRDIALTNGNLVYVHQGAGGFTFRPPESHVAADGPLTIMAADLNRDGWPDLTTTAFLGFLSVQLNEPVCRRRTVRP